MNKGTDKVIDTLDRYEKFPLMLRGIDGCIDMAMKDNMLYADNAVDLITIKPNANFTSIEVTGRIPGIFPPVGVSWPFHP